MRIGPILPIVLILGGCAARDAGLDAIARGIDEACERGMSSLAMEARKQAVKDINERTHVGNHTASDCDSDGLPDFAIDAGGLPVME
jgi:hypothetical protein